MGREENQINDLMKTENSKIDQEKKQIADLQAKIDKINKNIEKRQDNNTQYSTKLASIQKEKGEWEDQKHTAEAEENRVTLKKYEKLNK